jgi:2-amino-4-hydroxy-6-hydroxymethyldihydropteridine diphosphokinase/dihydropteroate synthase
MIYISLGSNLGNRLFYLKQAIAMLKNAGFILVGQSIIIETAALLPPNAPQEWNLPYLNMMVAGTCHLTPHRLLKVLKQIEQTLGREKQYEKWSPRIIDLDLVLWDDQTVKSENLTIPHPELSNRYFWQYLLHYLGHNDYLVTPSLEIISTKVIAPKLMGIVNVTQDSFSDGGLYFNADLAHKQVLALHDAGAYAIDLGAQSTRPGAMLLAASQEIQALDPVLQLISKDQKLQGIQLSIDTFRPDVAIYLAKKYPIKWINDVSGKLDLETLKTLQKLGCGICIMHSLSIPADPKLVYPENTDVISEIMIWAKKKLSILYDLGFSKDQIILDPGIGFGKTSQQSINILNNLENFKKFEVPILIGHSRKSFIKQFSKTKYPKDRDFETIAMTLAMQNKADWFRVHAVAEHMRSMVAYALLKKLK